MPTLLSLKERGYGEDKGIATLVIASSSIDDVLSISVFGVLMASIFSPGGKPTCIALVMQTQRSCYNFKAFFGANTFNLAGYIWGDNLDGTTTFSSQSTVK